jgi:hypothetical protein
VSNITLRNPGFWNLVPVRSSRITIEGVNVTAAWSPAANKDDPFETPNTDGFEPMWSTVSTDFVAIIGLFQLVSPPCSHCSSCSNVCIFAGSLTEPITEPKPNFEIRCLPRSRFDSDLSTRCLPHVILLLSIHYNLRIGGVAVMCLHVHS